ncbi:hypothetical protein LCGC14_2554210, partial [marine sediment metagenome]
MPVIPANLTVRHSEVNGSPKERFNDEGHFIERVLECDWVDRHKLMQELLGKQIHDSDTGLQTIFLPHKFEFDPSVVTAAFARGVSIEPFDKKVQPEGGDTQLAAYERAQLTVNYMPGRIDDEEQAGGGSPQDSDVLIEEEINPEAEII